VVTSSPRRSAPDPEDSDDDPQDDRGSDEFPSLAHSSHLPPTDRAADPGRRSSRRDALGLPRGRGRPPAPRHRQRPRGRTTTTGDHEAANTAEEDDPLAGPPGSPRPRGRRRRPPAPAPPPDRSAAPGHGTRPRRPRQRGSRSVSPSADEQAPNFVDRCFAWSLALPKDNFLSALERAGAGAPPFMDPRDLEERCAAIAWMNAFLDADGDPNEWAKLPEHMRRTLLSLFPLPRLRAGGTSLSKWERLAFAVPLSRRLACRRPRSPVEVVHVQGSPSPDPADPASTHGGPINTSRSQDPLSRHPAPRQPSSCSGPPSQRRRPRAPTPEADGAAYWGPRLLNNDEPSELVTPDSMPKALWNAMDPRPDMSLDKKAKFNDNLSKPGLANDQLHPAFIFTYSLDLHSGTALDVHARAHALAAAARSIQLDVDGHLLSPKKDPSRFTNRSELREHAGYWHKVGWIFSPITYQDINAIKEAIEFVYSRCVQRSETYHVKAIQKGVMRIYKESQSFFDTALHLIADSHQYEPAHLQWWKGNKDIYTLLYPFYAEHILGQSAITADALKAEVGRLFAVPPMASYLTHGPLAYHPSPVATHQAAPALPAPQLAAPPPPPPYVAPTPAPAAAAPKFLPPVPPFAITTPPAPKLTPPASRPTSKLPGPKTFIGRPCSMAIVGMDVAVALPTARPACGCAAAPLLPGPHRVWECPLSYFARFGSCPGFLPSGARDPAAWITPAANTGNLLPAAKAAWRAFIAAHHLERSNDALGDAF